jgi:hypothetical protein
MSDKTQISRAIPARVGLLVLGLACAALLLQTAASLEDYPFAVWFGLAAAAGALGLGLAYVAVFAQWHVVRRIGIEIVALAAVLLLVETAMALFLPPPDDRAAQRRHAASRLGIDFDERSRSEVVADLRRDGVDAYPGTGSSWGGVPMVQRRLPTGFYPFSHASNVTVVECNESGAYHTYETDEWGFNNPPGVVSAGHVDVAIVGESYALGHCLPTQDSLAGLVRAEFPRTANFGMAGTTTLHALGILREYVAPLRPHVVLWTVNPYFVTADAELENPVLSRYLEPGFSQRLALRQPETDRLVREIAIPVQAELDRIAADRSRQSKRERVLGSWRLPELRASLGAAVRRGEVLRGATDLSLFKRTLELANEETRGWGGKLVVVLLPIYAEVVAGQVEPDRRHENLARVVQGLGIPFVDGVRVFRQAQDPAALFTLRINNHPNAEGYALLAGEVIGSIRGQEAMQVSAQ